MVHHERRVRRHLAKRRGERCGRVDRDDFDPGPELRGLQPEPAADARAGPARRQSQDAARVSRVEVDEAPHPGIGAAPARLGEQPPDRPGPGLIDAEHPHPARRLTDHSGGLDDQRGVHRPPRHSYSRATSDAERVETDTACSSCSRNRRVSRCPAPTYLLVSADVRRRQCRSRHAHRRWSHHTRNSGRPCGRSLTRRSLRLCTDLDSTPQSGHACSSTTPSTTTSRPPTSCSCCCATNTTRNQAEQQRRSVSHARGSQTR